MTPSPTTPTLKEGGSLPPVPHFRDTWSLPVPDGYRLLAAPVAEGKVKS